LIEELKELRDVDITPEKMRQVFTSTFAKADEGMKGQINMAGNLHFPIPISNKTNNVHTSFLK
jgi:hypothetical protein